MICLKTNKSFPIPKSGSMFHKRSFIIMFYFRMKLKTDKYTDGKYIDLLHQLSVLISNLCTYRFHAV